jgi:mono/diheme cytochrome c family protein
MRRTVMFAIGMILLIVFAACGAPTAPSSVPSTAIPPTSVPLTAVPPTVVPTMEPMPTPLPNDLTAAEIAVRGRQVFGRRCAQCHDGLMEPIFADGYRRFPDAGTMLSFARSNMPLGNAGSLLPEEYFAVIVDFLVAEKFVAPDAILDPNKLGDIKF